MDLKGSKTEECLQKAFAGESQAYTKYMIYSSQARKDGYMQISSIFAETADNEKTHAKIWFKQLHGGSVPPTLPDLEDAMAGEHYETSEMYPSFAKIADEEGFKEIAALFRAVGNIEAGHDARYKKLIDNVENGQVFKRDEPVVWQCRECGHLQRTAGAPDKCPVCGHPMGYFQLEDDNY